MLACSPRTRTSCSCCRDPRFQSAGERCRRSRDKRGIEPMPARSPAAVPYLRTSAPRTSTPSTQRLVGVLGRDGGLVLFAGADAVDALDGEDEDLAVAHVAGVGGAEDGLHGHVHEAFRYADLQAHLLLQLHLHRGATVGLHALQLAAVALHAGHGKAAHLGPVQRLERFAQLFGADDGYDQLHAASLGADLRSSWGHGLGRASAAISSAPSPWEYASSPCCTTSIPTPCPRLASRSGATSAIALRITSVAMPLYAALATTASACLPSCAAFPYSSPSVPPHAALANTPVISAPKMPPSP